MAGANVYTLIVSRLSIALIATLASSASTAEFREVPPLPQAAIPMAAAPGFSLSSRGIDLASLLAAIPPPAPEAAAPQDTLAAITALAAKFSDPATGAPRDPAQPLESFWTATARVNPGDLVDIPRPRQESVIIAVVQTALSTPTGRRVLSATQRLTNKEGRRVPVELRPLGKNYGEYDYLKRVLYINKDLARDDIKEAAATLVHELVHVLQHERHIPAESLEMELEAHIVTLQMLAEMGIKPRPGTFSAAALQKIRESPAAYVAWMETQLPSKYKLSGADFGDLAEDLEQEADEAEGPMAEAVERDLAIVRSPSGRKRCLAFAAHVKKLLARFHAAQVGPKNSTD